MKKKLLAILALMPVLFFSCSKDEEKKPERQEPEVVTVPTETFSVPASKGTVEIPVSTNVNLTVTVDAAAKDWLFYSQTKAVADRVVVLSVSENTTPKTRTGNVTIKGKDLEHTVAVTQAAGAATVKVAVAERTVNPRGASISLKVTTNDDELTVSTTANWVKFVNKDANGYNFTVAVNDSGEYREAEVVFASKADPNVKDVTKLTQKVANTDPNAISILAIGNSFSVDAMEYLYPLLQELGYTKIRLGNLYVGSCSLETHLANMKSKDPEYTYYTNVDGTWKDSTGVQIHFPLEPDDWDYITIQQNSGNSGDASTYEPLGALVDSIRVYCEYTPLVWHQTWAYAGNSTHADFARYSNDQDEMYESIVAAVQDKIKVPDVFESVIPAGTTIQNLRTTFFEDNLTRDGYHLSYNIGRVAAAFTWAKVLTGKDIGKLEYSPKNGEGEDIYNYDDTYFSAIREAVGNAVAKPFEVTASTAYAPVKTTVPNNELRAVLEGAGYNPANYTEVSLTLVPHAYYNSTASQNSTVATASPSNIIAPFTGSTAENCANFVCTHILEKAQLPVGTFIVLKEGYSYRPDGWTALGTATAAASRPANVTTQVVEVGDEWWGSFNYRGFNIQKDGEPLSEADIKGMADAISIFIPKTSAAIGGQDYDSGSWNW